MAGSTFGRLYRVTTWGESHGRGIGCVIDGCPSGVPLREEDIQVMLERRKPGQSRYTTKRQESDLVEIWSGTFEGKTTGTPISLLIRNQDQRSKDYSQISQICRPGHADYPFEQKYGFRDYRGGGRSSGRETAARVAGGAVAEKVLNALGIRLLAYTKKIGSAGISMDRFDRDHLGHSPLCMPDPAAEAEAAALLEKSMSEKDSLGGIVECVVHGLPAGIGEPVFDKLDALIGQALFSIGAVKGVEIGDGFAAADRAGSFNNDEWEDLGGKARKKTNHAGGIYGGMSDGSEMVVRAAFKPTPSIGKKQHALGSDGCVREIEIAGRHDPVIVPRAVVVVESMVAMVLLDLLLQGMGARVENLEKIYGPKD